MNRGRIPLNYKDSKIHHNTGKSEVVEVSGCLFYSEGIEKTEDKNACFLKIDLDSFVEKTSLENREMATFVYLKAVELKVDGTIEQCRLPRAALPSDLCYWYVTPQKHAAYATFWFFLTGLISVANVSLWAAI